MDVQKISDGQIQELLSHARGMCFTAQRELSEHPKDILEMSLGIQDGNYGSKEVEFNVQAIEWHATEVLRQTAEMVADAGKVLAIMRDIRLTGGAINDRNMEEEISELAEQLDQMTEATEAEE